MRTQITFFFSLSLLVTASGCAETTYHHGRACAPVHDRTARTIMATADTVLAVAELAQAIEDVQAVTQEDDTPPEPPAAVRFAPIGPYQPPAAADTAADNRTQFDLGGAYGAIAHVDLGACRAQGLAAGYGRVEVGFAGDGSTRDLHVALPAGSPDGARACVETAFRQVRVAPFDGAQVTVRRSFYVGA
jgi:hypothetical protein